MIGAGPAGGAPAPPQPCHGAAPALEPAFARAFARSTTLRRQFLELMAAEAEHGGILWPLVLRLPRPGLMAVQRRRIEE